MLPLVDPVTRLARVAVFVILTLAPFATPSRAADAGAVEGRVTAAKTGDALAGLTVSVKGLAITAQTDEQGRYRLAGLTPGAHVVIARQLGYLPVERTVDVVAGGTASLDLVLEDAPAQPMEGVVVTATRTERRASDLPMSTSVMAREEVHATPAQAIDDVVRSVPSVNLPYENSIMQHPTSNSISMRGLGGYRALVLLDDTPLNDAFSGYVLWNKVPMEMVERVEAVRGGSSSLFGTYALAGVVGLVSRTPRENLAELEASYGTDATRRANFLGSFALTSKLRLTAGGNLFNTDGYVRPVPEQRGPIDIAGRSDARNARGRLDYRFSDATTAAINSSYYEMSQNEGTPLGTAGHKQWDVSGSVRRLLAGGGTLRASLFYQNDRPHTENTDPIAQRGHDEFLSNIHQTPADDVGGSLIWNAPVKAWKGTGLLGVDARSIKGEDRADNYSAPGVFSFREVAGGTQQSAGVFGELGSKPVTGLEILAGARLDTWRNVDGHDTKTPPGGTVTFPDKSKSRVNPRLAARWEARRDVVLRGVGYSSFMAPTLDQLYRPFTATGFAAIPNPDLGPETSLGGELGADLRRGAGTLQLTAFQTNMRDVITSVPVSFSPLFTVQSFNLARSRSRGVELLANAHAGNVDLEAGYTFTESVITENPADPSLVGTSVPDIPKHAIVGSVRVRRAGLTGMVRGRYIGARSDPNNITRRLSPHAVFDASAAYDLPRGTRVFVEAVNLLDREYIAQTFGYDGRGTPFQVYGGVKLELTELGVRR